MTQPQHSLVAGVYARALLGAAHRLDAVQRTREDAAILLDALKRSPKLRVLMENPRLAEPAKHQLLDRVFAHQVGPALMRLLHMLVARRRAGYLAEILNLVTTLCDEEEGLYAATVSSAIELDSRDRQRLKAALDQYTRRTLKLQYVVDSGLLGGIVFRFRDLLIDFSLRGKMKELRRALLGAPIANGRE